MAVGLTVILVPLAPVGIPVLAAGLVAVAVALMLPPGRTPAAEQTS
jgi:hypothetical protein